MIRAACAALVCAVLSGCAQLAAPFLAPDVTAEPQEVRAGAYALDPAHASVLFKIDHLGYSAYLGRFESWDASLDFDAEDPGAARLEAVVEMSSLDIANEAFARTLLGPDWFDAGRHPQAVFRSTSARKTGESTGVVEGDLTLHGVTAPVSFEVTFNGGGQDRLRGAYVVGFSARGTIDRTVFGVDRFSGLIADEVAIEIEAEFLREGEAKG